jgi:hypothetical protein
MKARPIQTARPCRSMMGRLSGDISSMKKCHIQLVVVVVDSSRVVCEITDRCAIPVRLCPKGLSHLTREVKRPSQQGPSGVCAYTSRGSTKKALCLSKQDCLLDPRVTTKRGRIASQRGDPKIRVRERPITVVFCVAAIRSKRGRSQSNLEATRRRESSPHLSPV